MCSPKTCPVCSTSDIQPVLRSTLLSAEIGDEVYKTGGVLAYRCAYGHVFMVVRDSDHTRVAASGL